MHEDSCIGINYAHMFPKCVRSLHTLLGFALYFVSTIQLLSLYPFIQFLTCTRIPGRDSHCENGSFEVLSLQLKPSKLDLFVHLVLHLLLVAGHMGLPAFDHHLKVHKRAPSKRNDRAQKGLVSSSPRRIISLLVYAMPPTGSSASRRQ